MRIGFRTVLALATAILAACDDTVPDDQEVSGRATDAQDPAVQPVASLPVPDTLAAALRAHLQAVDYRNAWSHWPGLAPYYEGGEPHGLLLATYANEIVHETLRSGLNTMPSGALVVKENYAPDSTLVATTVMYKQAGYDGAHHDWFFVKYGPGWDVETSPEGTPLAGRVQGCQDCHAQRADFDYLHSPRPAPTNIR